jgi:hypothetical protein
MTGESIEFNDLAPNDAEALTHGAHAFAQEFGHKIVSGSGYVSLEKQSQGSGNEHSADHHFAYPTVKPLPRPQIPSEPRSAW